MSLTIDLTKIKDYETKCLISDENGTLHYRPEARCIGFLSAVLLGVPEITKKNASNAYQRYVAACIVSGGNVSEIELTARDFEEHIGMRTNGNKLTQLQFQKRLGKIAMDSASRLSRSAQ